VSHLIYENKTPDSIVEIQLYDHVDKHYCCFIARNLMTEASALGLLHFFHHLRDVGLEDVLVHSDRSTDIPVVIGLNQQFSAVLSRLPSLDGRVETTLQCRGLCAPLEFGDERMQLFAKHFRCKSYFRLYLRDAYQLDAWLQFIANGEARTQRLYVVLRFDVTSHDIDRIIQYFEHKATSLVRATDTEIALLSSAE